jgi:hypothetical protein
MHRLVEVGFRPVGLPKTTGLARRRQDTGTHHSKDGAATYLERETGLGHRDEFYERFLVVKQGVAPVFIPALVAGGTLLCGSVSNP